MKQTALHQVHKNLGGKMVEYAGFEMPVQYAGVIIEHMAVRNKAGIFDVSHMGEFVLKGKDAIDLLQYICSNDIAKLVNGQAQYNCMPNEKGGIVDDLIVYRYDENEFYLVVNAANLEKDFHWIQQQIKAKNFEVELTNISDDLSLIALQGPKAQNILQTLTDVDLSSIPFYHFSGGTVANAEDVIISNTGYTGSGGFELYVWNKDAEKLWNALMEAGKVEGLIPCGLAARDTLRLEKGYCLYGNDIHDDTTPLEAGLGWITKFNKDFIAKEILAQQKEKGVSRKLVAFKMTERGVPRKGYPITDEEGNRIGEVTSGTQSPQLKEGIGMGYVPTDLSAPGNKIHIEIRNKPVPAEVVKLPFV